MVATDDDRRLDGAGADHGVELETRSVALAIPEPADPRRQALEGDSLSGEADPARGRLVFGEHAQHRLVGRGDVRRVARERRPAERTLALAKKRANVGGHETREGKGPFEPGDLSLGADRVPVVEHLGAGIQESHHRLDVGGDRLAGAFDELVGIAPSHLGEISEFDSDRKVLERVVSRGLIGDKINFDPRSQESWQRLGGVGDDPDRKRPALGLCRQHAPHGVV